MDTGKEITEKTKLSQQRQQKSDVCTKCLNEKGALFHWLWEYPKIQNFWKDFKCLSETLNMKNPFWS